MVKINTKYIIISIIVIVVLILIYYNTKLINHFTNDDEIIITMSTSPKRLENIKDTLKSILNQSVKPSKIFINVPHIFKRTNETYDDAKLEDIKNIDPIIQINRCEDKGPITKMLETLKLISNDTTIIIIIDDDNIYDSKTIENITNELKKNPNKVIAGSIFNHENINIVEGFKCICFQRHIFEDDFYELVDETNPYVHCYKSDDFIISYYLNENEIASHQIPIEIKVLDYGLSDDALHKQDNINHPQRYSKCNSFIKNDYEEPES
jgi:hypothetical protein